MNTKKPIYSTSIRLPLDIEEKIRIEAENNERSISAEIIYILKQYFKDNE